MEPKVFDKAPRTISKTAGLRKGIGALAAAGLVLGVLIPALSMPSVAYADGLEDQANQLKQQAADVQASLEFVDAGIAKSAADLTLFSGMLPGAQQALTDAQGRVGAATSQVQSLAARVSLAQQSRDKIAAQIVADKEQTDASKVAIGRIAAQSYKSGGVAENISMLLGTDLNQIASNLSMADQVLRSKYAALDKLNQQSATNLNSQARLVAVEAEITDLKAKADAALAAEKAAQDEAAAKKTELDKLVTDTTALSNELNAKKPEIQAKLTAVKTEQDSVAAQIAERQRQEILAEQARQREAAKNQGNNTWTPPPPGNPSAFGLLSPFAGAQVTSGWGWRAVPAGTIDFNGTGSYLHTGIDYGVTCGTPVRAPASGTVTIAGWLNNGGGNTVMLSNGVLQGNALTTVFYHNSSVAVSVGQPVSQGQVIAYTGNTGNSTGCHAHFETWLNGSPVNPAGLL